MQQENYRINLDLFEGPLDLLLHLIKKNDIDIYDIPIAFVLEKYFEYLDLMQELDCDVAGEFILLASDLTHIKSRMLLHSDDEEDEEEPDPRADLVARLLEYQKYKVASEELLKRPLLNRDVFKRSSINKSEGIEVQDEELEIDPYLLLTSFRDILRKVSADNALEIEVERISITDRIYQIVERLRDVESLLFEELFEGEIHRQTLIITFLSLLEMTRLKMIRIFQMDRFGPIRVQRAMQLEQRMDIKGIEGAVD